MTDTRVQRASDTTEWMASRVQCRVWRPSWAHHIIYVHVTRLCAITSFEFTIKNNWA